MNALLCVDTEYRYMGAVVRVLVNTLSMDVCNEVKELFGKSYETALEYAKKSGCIIVSEQPLVIRSGDNAVEIVLEPKNALAKMFWSEAVRRMKSYCPPSKAQP